MEELQKFVNNEFDKYKHGVSDFGSNPPEYNKEMSNATKKIKDYIEEKYSNIIVNDGILDAIKFTRSRCHDAWNKQERFSREVERGSIGVDMRRGPRANYEAAEATERYNNFCSKLFSCIEISQEIDPNSIDEQVFEKLRKVNEITVHRVKDNYDFENVPENVINFSNPIMQYAYNKYCQDKEKEEKIQSLQNDVKKRDEIITQDTRTMQLLCNITEKYKKAIGDNKSTLQKIIGNIRTTTTKVDGLDEMYKSEAKKSIFTRIKEKVQSLFNKNLMLPEHTKFNESINNVKQELNNHGLQVEGHISQIDRDVALNENESEIPRMMSDRTSLLTKLNNKDESKSKKESEIER